MTFPDIAPGKPLYKSRIFWVNMIGFTVALLALATDTFTVDATTLQWLIFFQSALTIMLRLLTTQPITLHPEAEPRDGQR